LHVTPQDTQGVAAPLPATGPTVAETGMPVSAGASGPGPASGSLLNLKPGASGKAPTTAGNVPSGGSVPDYYAGGTSGGKAYESAEEEKKRLQREERERILQGNAPGGGGGAPGVPAAMYLSADDEKKRLEREERDRLLAEGGSAGANQDGQGGDGGAKPPPYQDFN